VSTDLDRRLQALAAAADVADGRLEPAEVARARAVVAKAGARLGLGVERTVVALAGPTGVGKSALFNALTGAKLAEVGRRRPTTATGQAAAFGEGADPLLDWLEIDRRRRLAANGFGGLVLLDLPDFDSVELDHRREVDRVVELADLVVWVVEPQKYADASLHERYLRPLSSHAASMAVVLNQADLLAEPDVRAWEDDAARLLAEDGLDGVPVLVVSATTGLGLDELRELLSERIAVRRAAVVRLAADVDVVAEALGRSCGDRTRTVVAAEDRTRLVAALEEAAGVPEVARAVGVAHRRRGALAAGWPYSRWLLRLRPDPLKRLRVPETPEPLVRTSRMAPSDAQRAQALNAARRLADSASDGLPDPWPRLVRESATAREAELADHLDRAVASADLHVRRPRWWRVAGLLQYLLALVALTGAAWLLVLAVAGYLRIEDVVPLPEVRGVPIPTWLVLVGIAAGLAAAFVTRVANGLGARRRSRAAARSLHEQIEEVARELVLDPVAAELAAHERLREALMAARGG
jgi:GTP-binding protein EngB required for normal cell division